MTPGEEMSGRLEYEDHLSTKARTHLYDNYNMLVKIDFKIMRMEEWTAFKLDNIFPRDFAEQLKLYDVSGGSIVSGRCLSSWFLSSQM